MITLYVKSNCRFSQRAIDACEEAGVPFEKKNIADPVNEMELMKKGGQHQVPFLEDGEVQMYDSEKIAAYISQTYGTGEQKEHADVTLHTDSKEDTCS